MKLRFNKHDGVGMRLGTALVGLDFLVERRTHSRHGLGQVHVSRVSFVQRVDRMHLTGRPIALARDLAVQGQALVQIDLGLFVQTNLAFSLINLLDQIAQLRRCLEKMRQRLQETRLVRLRVRTKLEQTYRVQTQAQFSLQVFAALLISREREREINIHDEYSSLILVVYNTEYL